MTPEESKKYLEIIVGDWSMEFVIGPIRTEVLKKAIDALEKQVQKKPLPASDIDEEYLFGKESVCPNCRHMVVPYSGYYCPWCGQLIDWEDEE